MIGGAHTEIREPSSLPKSVGEVDSEGQGL